MTTCPKCAAPVIADAQFCANCGAPPGALHKPRYLTPLLIVSSLIVAVFALWGVSASGVLGSSASRGHIALSATGDGGVDVLATPKLEGTDTLAITAELPPPSLEVVAGRMPQDISDWLDHLLRTHNRLRGLNRSLSDEHAMARSSLSPNTFSEGSAAEAAADDARRRGQAQNTLESVNAFFVDVSREFRSAPAPRECEPLAMLYGAALGDIPVMIEELMSAVQDLDLVKAQSVGAKHRPLVEGRISETNRLISELSERYGVANRWRLVEDTDYGMGGMLGMGGLGLSGDAMKEYGELLRELLEEE